jgi:hypothetical protein
MHSHSKHILSLVAGIAIAGAILGGTALAGNTVRIDSKVTMSDRPPAFHGKVVSDNRACEQGRRVKLFNKLIGPDELLGSDRTNNAGRWVVALDPLSSGAYYAKVIRRSEGAAGTTFICKADISRTLIVD